MGIVFHLFSMVSFFASTRPIRSGVGAIDDPEQSRQVFGQHDICHPLSWCDKIHGFTPFWYVFYLLEHF